MHRRHFLAACAALFCTPAFAAGQRLAAAWQANSGYQVGILEQQGERIAIVGTLEVPTRAHGLLQEPEGTLLAVARRPGDWLLRWRPDGTAKQWRWSEPGRAFTGHALRRGGLLYTAESDLDSGAGLIGVRDAITLEKLAEWPTHGSDPHQLLQDQDGALLVANGGVPTRPETGRAKQDLERMDSSLVRLHPETGQRLGQWRLADRRLSLRHLAWNGRLLGIALQAEHDDPAARAAAPVLARFDGETLQTAPAAMELAGYGGDIAPLEDGFAVSCPRAGGIAWFDRQGRRQGFLPLSQACALAAAPLVAGGGEGVYCETGLLSLPAGLRLDNHWIVLAHI